MSEVNVNNIINSIEHALKNSNGSQDSEKTEPQLPRLIDPSASSNKDSRAAYNFRGKTIAGRIYLDSKGTPFRNISWLQEVYLPYQVEGVEGWRSRTIRTIASSNYLGIKPEEVALNRKLENLIRDFKNKFVKQYIPGSKYVKGDPIVTTSREVVLFYFKPQFILSNGIVSKVPEFAPGSYILSKKSGLLQAMLNAFQTENTMGADGWADKLLTRKAMNQTSLFISANLSGKSWSWTVNFKAGKGIELTDEDLEASEDLYKEFIPNIFDAERAESDLKFLEEQIAIRESAVLENFDSVEPPKSESSIVGDFKSVSPEAQAKPIEDEDIPF